VPRLRLDQLVCRISRAFPEPTDLSVRLIDALYDPEGSVGRSVELALRRDEFDRATFTPAQRCAILQWLVFYWRQRGHVVSPRLVRYWESR
jgi:hypothetical protein